MRTSRLEDAFDFQCAAVGLRPVREYRFHPKRKWRFDAAFPELKLAIELEGGVWTRGRHTRGSGFTADCEKYNHAAVMGWRVLRFTGAMVKSGQALAMTEAALRSA